MTKESIEEGEMKVNILQSEMWGGLENLVVISILSCFKFWDVDVILILGPD